jgi:hypothetical protein
MTVVPHRYMGFPLIAWGWFFPHAALPPSGAHWRIATAIGV